MNQQQTERVRSYLRGRLQLAIVPVGVRTGGGFIATPLGQTVGNGEYYSTLEELAQRHGVTIPESIMHGPLDHKQPTQPRKPTEEEQRQIDEMGHCGDFYALSEYLEERGLHTSDAHDFEGIAAGVTDRPCTRCGLPDRHPVHAVRESDAVSVAPIEGQNAVATIERTEPMRVHKSVVIRFLLAHPDEREQVIPGWVGTIKEYIAELERRPEQFFVNGELQDEET